MVVAGSGVLTTHYFKMAAIESYMHMFYTIFQIKSHSIKQTTITIDMKPEFPCFIHNIKYPVGIGSV